MTTKHYDVVVVGGGFFGGILGAEFSKANKNVLVLEAGMAPDLNLDGYNTYMDEFYNALAKVPNSPYPANKNAQSPNALDFLKPPEDQYYVQEGPMPFDSTYTRILGGTSLHWLGITLRMLPSDFNMKTNFDVGDDWPIDYEDLQRWYNKAEWELGVAADVKEQSYFGLRFTNGYNFPMMPIPETYLDRVLEERVAGQKYSIDGVEAAVDVVKLPVARNSTPTPNADPDNQYRPIGSPGAPHIGERCEGNASCIPICPVQAKFSSLRMFNTLKEGEFQEKSIVSKILFDEEGRVSGLQVQRYEDPDKPGHRVEKVTAKKYVLAGNAIENARLMLASDAPNTNRMIGANLMDHPYFITWARMPEGMHVGPFRGPLSVSGIPCLRDGKFRRKKAAFRTDIGNWAWDFPGLAPYADVGALVKEGLFGSNLRKGLYDRVQRAFRLGFLMEQLPDASNRVEIRDRKGKLHLDQMGNPRPVLYYDIDKYTQDGMKEAKKFSDWLYALAPQAEDFSEYKSSDRGYIEEIGLVAKAAGHLCGTHRMGKSKKDSVVNEDCRSHEHENLYMVGCGSMVTVGTANPSLTGAALAYRAADTIIKELDKGA